MKKITIIAFVMLLAFSYACKESFLETKPLGRASDNVFYNEKGVNALLTGAYALIDGAAADGWFGSYSWAGAVSNWVWGGVASDDAYKGTEPGDQPPINDIERYEALPTNQYVGDKWLINYDGVSRANDCLKVLKKTLADNKISAAKATQVEAEAKFLRAWFHFELKRVYNNIPYITDDVDPKTVKNTVDAWPAMIADMKFAADNLPANQAEVGRPTKFAAMAVLARIHMFKKDFASAKPLLDAIINSGKYSLVDAYHDNYRIATKNNKESIFEIQYAVNDGADESANGGWGDSLNFPGKGPFGTCCGFYQPSQNLVNAFKVDANGLPLLDTFNQVDVKTDEFVASDAPFTVDPTPVDPRLDWTVGRRGVPFLDWGVAAGTAWVRLVSNGGPYLYKKNMFYSFEKNTLSTSTGWATGVNANNYRAYRLAHIYLWRAEVAVEENDLVNALKYVNLVRERAAKKVVMGKATEVIAAGKVTGWTIDATQPAANYNVKPYPSFATQDYARKAVRFELRLEFGMEGHRYFDLVRWGIADQVLTSYVDKEKTLRSHLNNAKFDKNKDEFWPIPQTQIDLQNVNGEILKQNAGF